MKDIAKLEKKVDMLTEAVTAMQKQLEELVPTSEPITQKDRIVASSSFLVTRKTVLAALGINRPVSRKSWSHEGKDAIVFDAWQHHWTLDSGKLDRYPVRTKKYGIYSLQEASEEPRPGHTRWQHHLDLVLAGKRKAIATVPVARDPTAKPNRGARGWLPQYVTGTIHEDSPGNFYFHADQVVPI